MPARRQRGKAPEAFVHVRFHKGAVPEEMKKQRRPRRWNYIKTACNRPCSKKWREAKRIGQGAIIPDFGSWLLSGLYLFLWFGILIAPYAVPRILAHIGPAIDHPFDRRSARISTHPSLCVDLCICSGYCI